jgi:hypothetical protein
MLGDKLDAGPGTRPEDFIRSDCIERRESIEKKNGYFQIYTSPKEQSKLQQRSTHILLIRLLFAKPDQHGLELYPARFFRGFNRHSEDTR